MLTVDVDIAAAEQRLAAMTQQFDQFASTDMAQGVTDWQIEDMDRQYPNVEQTARGDVSTRIWPRSRRLRPRARRLRPQQARAIRRRGSASQRPILRPQLFERLTVRMRELMAAKLTWL